MRKVVYAFGLGLAGLSLAAPEAWAVDWSVKGVATQGLELSDNQFLKTSQQGGSVGSYSNLKSTTEARTSTSTFDLDTDAFYRKYWGPGISGLPSEYYGYSVQGRYELYGKTTADRSYVSAGYGQQSAALAAFNALGLPSNANGLLNQTAVRGGLDRAITSTDTLSVWTRSIYTDYDPSNAGVAFNDALVGASWKHRVNSVLTVIGQSDAEFLNYQNVLNSRGTITRASVGVDAKLSPVLSIRATGGYALVDLNNILGFAPRPGIAPVADSSTTLNFISDLRIEYRPIKSAIVYLDASKSIGPSILGSILDRSNIRLGFDYDINYGSRLSFSTDFTRLVSPATTDFVSATIAYSRQLTNSWTARMAYNYIHRFPSTGSAQFDPILGIASGAGLGSASSDSVLVSLSKSFVAIPPGN